MQETKHWTIEEVFELPEGDLRFYGTLGIADILEEEDAVCTYLPVTREVSNSRLTVQGGALYALCDIGCAAFVRIKHGKGVTLNGTIHYYEPARPGDLLCCRASGRRAGKTIASVFCEVRDQSGKLIADSLQSIYRLHE